MRRIITKILNLGRRPLWMLGGMLLFLPPLAALPQIIGEPNLCGKVCPRLLLILPANQGIIHGLTSNIQTKWLFGAGLVLGILLITFFFGRLWCSHFCPIGGFTEMVSRTTPEKLKIRYAWLHAPSFRYGYFAVFVAGGLWGIGNIACKFCNFRVIPFLVGALFEPAYRIYLLSSIGLAGLFTVAAFGFFARGGRAYCNFFCPIGALDSLVNAIGSILPFSRRIRTDEKKCNRCGQCVGSCMVWARSLEKQENGPGRMRVDAFSCMSCRECTKACPTGAIRYGKREA